MTARGPTAAPATTGRPATPTAAPATTGRPATPTAAPATPTTPRPVRRRPAHRKSDIVDTARRLAAGPGLASVSMEDIATEVGITAGALYRHFPGRQAIVEAVRADTAERFVVAALQGAAAGAAGVNADDPSAPMRAIVAATVGLALDDPALLRVYTRGAGPAIDAELRLAKLWTEAVLAAAPGMPVAEARLRQAGVLGALAEATWRPGPVGRPRLDHVLSAACGALLLSRRPAGNHQDRPDVDPPTTGWRPPPRRQEEILAAALHLFRAKGFAGTTMEDIGRAVGLAASGIYRTYDNKADILLDAYDRVAARVEVGTEAALAAATTPADALRRLTISYCSIAVDNPDLIVVTGREGSGLPEEARPRIARRNRALRDIWVSVLTEIRSDLADPEARLLYRGVLSLANQAALLPDRRRPDPARLAGLMLAFLNPTPQPDTQIGEPP